MMLSNRHQAKAPYTNATTSDEASAADTHGTDTVPYHERKLDVTDKCFLVGSGVPDSPLTLEKRTVWNGGALTAGLFGKKGNGTTWLATTVEIDTFVNEGMVNIMT